MQKFLFPVLRVGQQFLPACHDGVVASLDGGRLLMFGRHELVFQCGDSLDAFLFKGVQTRRESFLVEDNQYNCYKPLQLTFW